jgi:hypothetical protein
VRIGGHGTARPLADRFGAFDHDIATVQSPHQAVTQVVPLQSEVVVTQQRTDYQYR